MANTDGDQVESVLSTQGRRVLCALLEDGSRDADPILEPDEMLDCEEYVTVCYELHHVILPGLAAANLVEFDRQKDQVTRGARFDEIRPYFDRIDEHGATTPSSARLFREAASRIELSNTDTGG